jgi:3-methyl-2-oxobutanoate hydroxymethyltransferase
MSSPAPSPDRPAVTLKSLARMAAAGQPFACLTCYDATTARWLARAGVHVLLVGDTAAEMVLGFPRTIDMPLDVLIALTAGVKRGAPSVCVMADMPFMSYHASPDQAVLNAGRFLVEGLADIVKIEADAALAPLVERMVRAGVPVCGHIGSRPQRAALTSGYASAGRTQADAQRVVEDAVALAAAGCSMLLLEAVPESVTREVLERSSVPVIGIGAGPACHGQVVVLQDLLGLTDRPPPFVQPAAALGEALVQAGRAWVARVADRQTGPSPYAARDATPARETPAPRSPSSLPLPATPPTARSVGG